MICYFTSMCKILQDFIIWQTDRSTDHLTIWPTDHLTNWQTEQLTNIWKLTMEKEVIEKGGGIQEKGRRRRRMRRRLFAAMKDLKQVVSKAPAAPAGTEWTRRLQPPLLNGVSGQTKTKTFQSSFVFIAELIKREQRHLDPKHKPKESIERNLYDEY